MLVPVADTAACPASVAAACPVPAFPLLTDAPPVRACAAVSLGCASPKPHPPSRSWATTGPAHLPELKPQQAEAQSASVVQAPVINCVPGAACRREIAGRATAGMDTGRKKSLGGHHS